MIIEVTDKSFQKDVIDKSKEIPVLVDFWAPWCQPCLMLGPVLEKLAEEQQGKFILAKVNVQDNHAIASEYGISGIPAVKLFKNGIIAGEFLGVMPEKDIRIFLKNIEPTETDAHIRRGDEYHKLGKLAEATEEYRNALKIDPENETLKLKLGSICFEQGNYDQAREYLKEVAYKEESQKILDTIYFKSIPAGNIDELLNKLTENPDALDICFDLAEQYARIGDYQKSMDYYLNILVKDKKYKDEIARKSMLKIFNILGDDHPSTKEYRRKLTDVIF